MPVSAPRLETERLLLRQFHSDDLAAHAATLADPKVMHFLGGKGMSVEDAWRRMATGVGLWALTGIGMWAVELKADKRLVGHIGFFDMRRDMQPSVAGEPEMGWIFDSSVHGQGIAREACQAALDWADQNLPGQAIPAMIDRDNIASIKLAEKLGFKRAPDALYKGEPIALFRRPARG